MVDDSVTAGRVEVDTVVEVSTSRIKILSVLAGNVEVEIDTLVLVEVS